MRTSRTFDSIGHGMKCQCMKKHLCLDKQVCHTQLFSMHRIFMYLENCIQN